MTKKAFLSTAANNSHSPCHGYHWWGEGSSGLVSPNRVVSYSWVKCGALFWVNREKLDIEYQQVRHEKANITLNNSQFVK